MKISHLLVFRGVSNKPLVLSGPLRGSGNLVGLAT